LEYKDYYKIMELKRDATPEQVKRAYRVLARKYHPDVSKEADAEARFKELGEAYEVLKDPKKRKAYDRLGSQWKAGQEFHPPPGWDSGFEFHRSGFGGSGRGSGRGFGGGKDSPFSDFFENLFGDDISGFSGASGGARSRGGQSQDSFFSYGGDRHATVVIDLLDAYEGATRQLSLDKTVLGANGRPRQQKQTLNVRIPKGVVKGKKIRLSGQGDPGMGAGKAGDLYLEIDFKPHPLYQVEGHDVTVELPVAPWELALGASVQAPTPAGKVDLKIPAGSANGRKLRLKGRGIPAGNGSASAGDLFVILKVVLPPADTEEAKEAYRALQRAGQFDPRKGLGG